MPKAKSVTELPEDIEPFSAPKITAAVYKKYEEVCSNFNPVQLGDAGKLLEDLQAGKSVEDCVAEINQRLYREPTVS